jgi:hypothetical protein
MMVDLQMHKSTDFNQSKNSRVVWIDEWDHGTISDKQGDCSRYPKPLTATELLRVLSKKVSRVFFWNYVSKDTDTLDSVYTMNLVMQLITRRVTRGDAYCKLNVRCFQVLDFSNHFSYITDLDPSILETLIATAPRSHASALQLLLYSTYTKICPFIYGETDSRGIPLFVLDFNEQHRTRL